MKKVAVILSGCGYLDGAEIRESVLTLLALECHGAQHTAFAPDQPQHHTVNHLNGEAVKTESRNVLQESARITRGKIASLEQLDVKQFDALVIPGGFGVAKNLCDFAFQGSEASIDPLVAEKIKAFKNADKAIGAICIAPALVALAIAKNQPTLTIGMDEGTATELEKLGAKHQTCPTTECVVDKQNKLVTTPAYMDDNASLPDVQQGINKLIENLLSLA